MCQRRQRNEKARHAGGAARVVASVMFAGGLLSGGCGRDAAPELPPPLTVDMSWMPLDVQLEADPGRVLLDRDVVLTLRVSAPSELDVVLPPVDGRVQGFALGGVVDREPVSAGGRTTLERRILLKPLVAEEYRIAPMAIRYTDNSANPPGSAWFPTRPLVMELEPPADAGDKEIEEMLRPVWVYPPFRTVAAWVVGAIAAAGALVAAWRFWPRLRREIRMMRLSPRERALRELVTLERKDFVRRKRFKDFYLELTMIVRRYVERAHAVRAPELTTEEFLEAVTGNPRFSKDTVARLRAFLEAADLVKFAAYQPGEGTAGRALETARDYVRNDPGGQDAGRDRESPEGGRG
jgi:hypothetical protein